MGCLPRTDAGSSDGVIGERSTNDRSGCAKTGSDDAVGGCFAFARVVRRHGHTTSQIGVVLGQSAGPLVPAAFAAARALADSLNDRQ